MAAANRTYTAGRFGIELEAGAVGFAESLEGGQAFAEVVEEQAGSDEIVHKHLGNVDYEELALTVGANMSAPFYDWIASTLDRKHERKNGAVSFQDYTGAEKERLSWYDGLISEIGFPALDGSSKESARLSVKIRPDHTKHAKGSGAKGGSVAQKSPKRWAENNFRLTITGVNCSHVQRIGALAIRQKVAAAAVGELRDHLAEPAALAIPNVVVTVSAAHAADFVTWHEDFVIKGNNDQTHEKEGKLEFLSPDLKEVLFTLTMRGLGIFRITAVKNAQEAAANAGLEAEMYCEEMSFSYSKAAAGGVTSSTGGGGTESSKPPDPTSVLAAALREVLAKPLESTAETRRPKNVAARLRATTEDGDSPAADLSRSSERGRRLGASWAREQATLEELEQLAATRKGEWTDLVLREGHSLLAYLQKAGVVPESHDGPLTLERDPFVEELVDGAADVYDEVRPHLAKERAPG